MKIGEGVENYLQKRLKDSEGLLVGLNSSGCVGFQIDFRTEQLNSITEQSTKISTKVYVDNSAKEILSECHLTISEDPFSEKLTVVVPKETFVQCGCAESFSPRDLLDY